MAGQEPTRWNIAQIGVGAWGATWLRVLAEHPRFELVALIDLDADALRAAAATTGLGSERCLPSLDALAGSGPEADVALVAVPPPAHAPVAVQALEAGLHCLIEKPLADTMRGAREILAARERSGKTAMVSQNYRFKRAPRTVRRLVREGIIGAVETVQVDFQKSPLFTGFRMEMEEPLILDMAIHHVDHLRGTAGFEPVRLRATSWNPSWSQFAGNAAGSIEFEGHDGARALYTGSWVSQGLHTTWDGTWEVQGERGAIRWDQNRVEIRFTSLFDTVFMPRAVEREGVMEVELDPLAREERSGVLDELALALDEGRSPETCVTDNVKSLALMLAAVESTGRDGEWIDLGAFAAR
jgi:predicted dehydrogenase